jgi:hypothetical protein
MQQGNMKKLHTDFVIEAYQNQVTELQNQLIMSRAYSKQLEMQLAKQEETSKESEADND